MIKAEKDKRKISCSCRFLPLKHPFVPLSLKLNQEGLFLKKLAKEFDVRIWLHSGINHGHILYKHIYLDLENTYN